ncbi:hypothetical protein [Flexivirga meconopsidis]|uniref:hypothetical protein n=1 Tax=Flexivirga meconopsidis TaxID=2977121 RepID=UPI00223F6784|nr:hypothetical protein [Flexivirga meconopsidis]
MTVSSPGDVAPVDDPPARYAEVKDLPGVDGFYVEGNEIVVLTTVKSSEPKIRAHGLRPKLVRYGMTDLGVIRDDVSKLMARDRSIFTVGIDPKQSVVLVTVRDAQFSDTVRDLQKRPGVKVEVADGAPSPA